MAQGSGIIGLTQWLQTPAGRYLLGWEQAHLDAAVVDIFGYHALQLGMPELQALRSNRMPHRWVATASAQCLAQPVRSDANAPAPPLDPFADTDAQPLLVADVALNCDFDALPFDTHSLDLVVLPHALELARDPHLALREVDRVLVPEGRVVIVGFNPASLWGLRQRAAHLRRDPPGAARRGFLPDSGEFIGYRRLRDWLRLLSFEVEAGRFGCYRPPVASSRWLARFEWTESVGERWWPVFGAVYFVVAVKRVRGMRLVGLAREHRSMARAAPATVASRHATVPDE
ncbi:MAG: methyltransferase domain-containing protein [Burkholderiaceae bacterium]